MAIEKNEPRASGGMDWSVRIVLCLAAYVLSSGPVLAIAFWFRDATRWDGFYGAMWIYFPLFAPGLRQLFDPYITWWVKLLGTMGPG